MYFTSFSYSLRVLNNSALFGVDIGVIQPKHGFIAKPGRTIR